MLQDGTGAAALGGREPEARTRTTPAATAGERESGGAPDGNTQPAATPARGLLDDAPVVYSYTRAQAIADGVLVAVTETAREAGFKWPVALTREVWSDCAEWTDADTERSRSLGGQSTRGRLWDVLFMAFMAIKARNGRGGDTLHYTISRLPRPGRGRCRNVELKLVTGPGDDRSSRS